MIQTVLPQSTFAKRREQLFSRLPEGAVVILYSGDLVMRNRGTEYPFRPDSYFWYFTGFPEPETTAILCRKAGKVHYTLFCANRDPSREIWTGKIVGQEGAVSDYGADEAYPLTEKHRITGLLAANHHIYAVLGEKAEHDQEVMQFIRSANQLAGKAGTEIEDLKDLRRIAGEMRMFKSIEEQNLLHEAGRITAAGHRAAMRAAQAGAYEYTAQAAMEAEFRRYHGCHWSFPSIIAAGSNACCLHYEINNAPLRSGDLVLFDTGAEYAGYAGDISRTIPINGKFTRNQQALYEVVLNAQLNAIHSARAGITHDELHRQASIDLMQGIFDLGIVDGGDAAEWVDSGKVKRFYPHSTGHWLGLDVHDVGAYYINGQSRTYQPDMVITIEPGLYLQPDDLGIDESWRGIGIRIEDDIIITKGDPEITTSDAPKTVREIEEFLSGRE